MGKSDLTVQAKSQVRNVKVIEEDEEKKKENLAMKRVKLSWNIPHIQDPDTLTTQEYKCTD